MLIEDQKGFLLTASKFERTRVEIHGKILKMHWTLSMHCQPMTQVQTHASILLYFLEESQSHL